MHITLRCIFWTKTSPSSSDPSSLKGWWTSLWKLNIPNKLKIFGWRAGREILPTLHGLWKRNIAQNPFCLRCRKKKETALHALIFCKASKKVWRLSSSKEILGLKGALDFGSLLPQIQESGSTISLEVVIAISWAIWFDKNKFVHEGRFFSPLPICRPGMQGA